MSSYWMGTNRPVICILFFFKWHAFSYSRIAVSADLTPPTCGLERMDCAVAYKEAHTFYMTTVKKLTIYYIACVASGNLEMVVPYTAQNLLVSKVY